MRSGLRMEFRVTPFQDLVKELEAGKFQIYSAATAACPSGYAELIQLYSRQPPSGERERASRLPEYDDAMEQFLRSPNEAGRRSRRRAQDVRDRGNLRAADPDDLPPRERFRAAVGSGLQPAALQALTGNISTSISRGAARQHDNGHSGAARPKNLSGHSEAVRPRNLLFRSASRPPVPAGAETRGSGRGRRARARPTACNPESAREISTSATCASSRARLSPAQVWMPKAKARCRFGSRARSSRSGSGNCAGSRFAAPMPMLIRVSGGMRNSADHHFLRRDAVAELHRTLEAQELFDGTGGDSLAAGATASPSPAASRSSAWSALPMRLVVVS